MTLNLLFFLDIAMKMGLLRRFWGIAQRAFPRSGFGFTPGWHNPEESKHSVFLSAPEHLHQLLELHVAHGANDFVSSGLDGLRVDICKQR
jgi:hypothetical protein